MLIFVFLLVLLAYGTWLSGNTCTLIWLSALVTIIFRSELSILCGLIILQEVVRRRVTIGTVLKYGIPAGLVSLGMFLLITLVVSIVTTCHRHNSSGGLTLLEEMVMA